MRAADERGQAAPETHVEAVPGLPGACQAVQLQRVRHVLQVVLAERLEVEIPRGEPPRRAAHRHRIGLRGGANARGDVRRAAERERLPGAGDTLVAYHRCASMDADPHGEAHAMLPIEAFARWRERLEDLPCTAHGPRRIVLARTWIAKQHEHTVALPSLHVAAEPLDRPRTHGLVDMHDLAQVFGIEPHREGSRTYEVA
jgi:hypothetical protein